MEAFVFYSAALNSKCQLLFLKQSHELCPSAAHDKHHSNFTQVCIGSVNYYNNEALISFGLFTAKAKTDLERTFLNDSSNSRI